MKILLVEDVRAVAAVIAARLDSFGHDVVLAENGKVAVEMFRKSAPDLILMDIEMPVMNGFEATNHIRAHEATQQWAWTPIIFLTATDTVENLITAIEAGGDDFMAKSVPESVLQAKMKALSRVAGMRQRLSIANRKLEELANRDGLTGLCNRRSMDVRVDMGWVQAMNHKCSFGLLMIDIDNFKKYNDHYGHQEGDDCLRSVADTIANVITDLNSSKTTENAFAARYGGEEFALIMPNVQAEVYEGITGLVVDAVRALNIPHEKNAEWGVVTISAGGAHTEVAQDEIASLFRLADRRLYQAKANGRNRAEIA